MAGIQQQAQRAQIASFQSYGSFLQQQRRNEVFEKQEADRRYEGLIEQWNDPRSHQGRPPEAMLPLSQAIQQGAEDLNQPPPNLVDPRDEGLAKVENLIPRERYGGRMPREAIPGFLLAGAGGDESYLERKAMQEQMELRMQAAEQQQQAQAEATPAKEGEEAPPSDPSPFVGELVPWREWYMQKYDTFEVKPDPVAARQDEAASLAAFSQYAKRPDANPTILQPWAETLAAKNPDLTAEQLIASVQPADPASPFGAWYQGLTPDLQERVDNTLAGAEGGITDPAFARMVWHLNIGGRTPTSDPKERARIIAAAEAAGAADIKERGVAEREETRIEQAGERIQISRGLLAVSQERLKKSGTDKEKSKAFSDVLIEVYGVDQATAEGLVDMDAQTRIATLKTLGLMPSGADTTLKQFTRTLVGKISQAEWEDLDQKERAALLESHAELAGGLYKILQQMGEKKRDGKGKDTITQAQWDALKADGVTDAELNALYVVGK